MRVTELSTPQVLVDRPRLLANLDRMQALASTNGLRLRPHAKTHKSPVVARWQIDRGAVGICCAKLGEAEVFAAAGLADVRLPYPVNPFEAPRVLALLDRTHLSIVVDHQEVACGWSHAMRRAGRQLDVLVKVDVGFHRCGIDPHDGGAVEFVERVANLPGLRLRGLLSHAGHGYLAASETELEAVARSEAEILGGLARALRARGVAIDEVSVGATPPARFSARQPGVTEMRPGNYAYFDRAQVALGAARLEDCALTVLARVVSKPASDRIILDCGTKTLTSDAARGFTPQPGHGLVFDDLERPVADEHLLVERLSEEHAVVRVMNGHTRLAPGDVVRVLPNHSCVVSNLVDEICLVDGLEVVDRLKVEARGRIR
ncbi:MAG: alanine racemase [Acidobacteria bacterium]|nr:alanine racemase [Acidobacteriota bacterium]